MMQTINQNPENQNSDNLDIIKEAYIVSQNMNNSDEHVPVCLANLLMIGKVEDIKRVKEGWPDLWEEYLSMGNPDQKL